MTHALFVELFRLIPYAATRINENIFSIQITVLTTRLIRSIYTTKITKVQKSEDDCLVLLVHNNGCSRTDTKLYERSRLLQKLGQRASLPKYIIAHNLIDSSTLQFHIRRRQWSNYISYLFLNKQSHFYVLQLKEVFTQRFQLPHLYDMRTSCKCHLKIRHFI
jgi:hypothetical protein